MLVSEQVMESLSCPSLLPRKPCASKQSFWSLRNVDFFSDSPQKENLEMCLRGLKSLTTPVSLVIIGILGRYFLKIIVVSLFFLFHDRRRVLKLQKQSDKNLLNWTDREAHIFCLFSRCKKNYVCWKGSELLFSSLPSQKVWKHTKQLWQ